MVERKSMRPNRSSMAAPLTSVQRQRVPQPNDKSSRASIATATPSKSTYAQKTKSSNSRLSDVQMEESNISVYVRCRSRNDREIKENSGVVVSTMGHMGKEVVLQTGPLSVSNKTYTFDRVFGAESDQDMMYEGIAKSVLQEMLQGYNCTVFAYGQTGTGKTYTMSGDIEMAGNRLSENAGIIPRTLVDLFKNLEKNPEFSVKISFIELYNEELRDLLLTAESEERKVKIYEDPSKKSIVVQGMEEVYIKSAEEGMKVLSQGSYNRQVAATKCNDLSSRSHSVFTITVHMKEIDPISGEEFLKIGKLNLVDLAGSENINRSGAENKRAREAGMINQSLLTLGRVINALVDQSSHIPYRESKLTRLLQDSLGGKTKTCIIATISPAKVSLEETISTLEYANRAKSIKNKPQVNQTMSKKMLIKEYVQEIERLRNDLNATRNKNGIYITEENWEQTTAESESRRILVEEQKLKMNVLEEQIKKFKRDFEDQLGQINDIQDQLEATKKENDLLNSKLKQVETKLYTSECELRLENFVNDDHQTTEKQLQKIHKSLSDLLHDVIDAKDTLHGLLEKKQSLENENMVNLEHRKQELCSHTKSLHKVADTLTCNSTEISKTFKKLYDETLAYQRQNIEENRKKADIASKSISQAVESAIEKITTRNQSTDQRLDTIDLLKSQIKEEIIKDLGNLGSVAHKFSNDVTASLNNLGESIDSSFQRSIDIVGHILGTVQSQLDAQSAEIIALKDKLVQHQSTHFKMLKEQSSNLSNLEQTEKERSRNENEELFKKIKDLIEEQENKRSNRLSNEIKPTYLAIDTAVHKQDQFTRNYEQFVMNSWVANQSKFRDKVEGASTEFIENMEATSEGICNGDIQKILSDVAIQQVQQESIFTKTVDSLDSKMTCLTECATDLKSLNKENRDFTSAQLSGLDKHAQSSFKKVIDTYDGFDNDLMETKTRIIGPYLSEQDATREKFIKTFTNNIKGLNEHLSSIEYIKDDMPLPKRQKITISNSLPESKPREEILRQHHDEIYINGDQYLGSDQTELKPIPDQNKQFKQPLNELNQDFNIMKENHNPNEMKVRQGKSSRSSSVLSARSQ